MTFDGTDIVSQDGSVLGSDHEFVDYTNELGNIIDNNSLINAEMLLTSEGLVMIVDTGVESAKTLDEATSIVKIAQDSIMKGVNKTNANESVENAKKVSSALVEQIDAVKTTKTSFEDISLSIKDLVSKVKEMQVSSGEMNEKKNLIQIIMTNLASVAEESAASTQVTSAASEEITASMEEIVEQLNTLSDMNKSLEDQAKYFTL